MNKSQWGFFFEKTIITLEEYKRFYEEVTDLLVKS